MDTGVDPQVHEAAPAGRRVEGGRQAPGPVGGHPAGELLLDQQGAVGARAVGEKVGQGPAA